MEATGTRVGTLNFVEGVLEGLMAAGAITRDEARKWKELLTATSEGAHARFSPSGGAPPRPSPRTSRSYASFIEFLSANEPAKVVPEVCSFQVLGVERYDLQVAVVWRMLPVPDSESADELKNLPPFIAGPEMSFMEVSDDRGTLYRMRGGSSGGGGGEIVGRWIFIPAPPKDATILTVTWEELHFEIPLNASHR